MTIIKNYGFLWDRKHFFRGAGNISGHMLGWAKGKKELLVDFRKQIGVYVLYDKNQKIVYVGQAGNGNATLFGRLRTHEKDALWNRWEYFTWIGFKEVNNDGTLSAQQRVKSMVSGLSYSAALNEIEGILIEVIEPKLNKRSGNLKKAVEYFQHTEQEVTMAD
ncbi:GIY-YIG nuclease family protein, partial [Limnohabitans sp.]